MQKESRKCDSVRVALEKKDALILELLDNNLKMFKQFTEERAIKTEALEVMNETRKKLDKFDKKRFGIGFSAGATLNSNFEVKPAILIGVSYSIFRF